MSKKFWLMKTEPNVYSIDDLKKDKKTTWDGIRNYQARNFMIKDMELDDEILIYHSRIAPLSIVGLAKVCRLAHPDPTAFDKKSSYYEPKATKDKPIWQCVDVKFVKKFKNPILLEDIKKQKGLEKMLLIKKGMRLSIQPVTEKEFSIILKMSQI